MKLTPNKTAPLGAIVEDVDLKSISDEQFAAIIDALARHGVLCFRDQILTDAQHVAFTSRIGPLSVNVASKGMTGDTPEIMIISNIVKDGKPIGLGDAGQDWHTDMSYSQVPGHATGLYAIEVPHDDGQPLGDTEFASMYLAYETLPEDIRTRIDGLYAVRDFAKLWNHMIKKGSPRPPLTPEQRRERPPVIHPLVMRHPVSGRKALYADPGLTVAIVGQSRAESDALLDMLFNHQIDRKFVYTHKWRLHDFILWDNIATIHRAIGGLKPHQHRHMRRTQIALDVTKHAGFSYTDNNAVYL